MVPYRMISQLVWLPKASVFSSSSAVLSGQGAITGRRKGLPEQNCPPHLKKPEKPKTWMKACHRGTPVRKLTSLLEAAGVVVAVNAVQAATCTVEHGSWCRSCCRKGGLHQAGIAIHRVPDAGHRRKCRNRCPLRPNRWLRSGTGSHTVAGHRDRVDAIVVRRRADVAFRRQDRIAARVVVVYQGDDSRGAARIRTVTGHTGSDTGGLRVTTKSVTMSRKQSFRGWKIHVNEELAVPAVIHRGRRCDGGGAHLVSADGEVTFVARVSHTRT